MDTSDKIKLFSMVSGESGKPFSHKKLSQKELSAIEKNDFICRFTFKAKKGTAETRGTVEFDSFESFQTFFESVLKDDWYKFEMEFEAFPIKYEEDMDLLH